MLTSFTLEEKPNQLYAHSPNNFGEWHDLEKHLRDVADQAASFSAKFGAEDIGRALGLSHDLAKANPAFQEYLQAAARGEKLPTSPHSDPSAAAVQNLLGPFLMCVQGHHSGLPDKAKAIGRLQNADPAAVEAAEKLRRVIRIEDFSIPKGVSPLEAEHLMRMTFSALVDADFMDTERHFDPSLSRGGFAKIEALLQKLEERLAQFPPPKNPVAEVRASVSERCYQSATQPQGFFRLSVPTGGGKTLASILFALRHAVHHGLDRVVVAIPYTSIIEQTAEVFREIFGKDNVLEHHSGRTPNGDERQDEDAVRARLATENWDHPLIVTTNVQLFESLLSNRTSRCRKLHNLAHSVIILDEVQTLPPRLLQSTTSVLDWLHKRAKTTVVFCTATQPNLAAIPEVPQAVKDAIEIVGDPAPLFEKLKRVEYRWLGEQTYEEVAARVAKESQCLAIFNTRKDSLAVFEALDDADSLYLSTFLVPHHRKLVLAEIKDRLDKQLPCRLISTQVVEAGVDVDFPLVLRVMAPLDSLIQAAGRCNRNGKLEQGICEVFQLAGGGAPRGVYQTAISVTGRFVPNRLYEIETPATQASYFAAYYSSTSTDGTSNGKDAIQNLRAGFNFEQVAQASKLIDQDTVPVVVRKYAEREVDAIFAGVANGGSPRLATRRLSQYSVNLYEHEARKAISEGLVEEHVSGFFIWLGNYHPKVGIGGQNYLDPADLMV